MAKQKDIMDLASEYRAKGEPYALATVVRTISVTAAKAGAKAVILADGHISGGWIGGGCARGAVLKAAREALADGEPRLISVQPEDLLQAQDIAVGMQRDGVRYAKNACPSQGTMDIFVEAVLPSAVLCVLGASPVAVAIADLGQRMGFSVTVCAPEADHGEFSGTEHFIDGFEFKSNNIDKSFVVVATQGKGDSAALKAVVECAAPYLSFVGSRKKYAALRKALTEGGIDGKCLDRVKAPAGLDIGGITPDEIAFSIIAEIIEFRRRGQRTA